MAAELSFVSDLMDTGDLSHLVTRRLFESVPHIFEGDEARWWQWKADLADGLDVDAHSVLLVGSASVGVSLNPDKNAKPFDETSDIDVAVISTRYFENAWHTLRSLGARLHGLPRAAQIDIKQHAPFYVFWGGIATDRILPHLEFGPQWVHALEQMKHRSPTKDRQIGVRLYRDISSLRSYQLRSVRKVRRMMETREA